jgi:CBS domain-containing protein
MKLIKHILKAKGQDTWTITPDEPVYNALQLMAEKNVGALVVVKNEEVIGVISERDYARKIILRGKSSRETLVREIMTSPAICVTSDKTVEQCLSLMTDKHIRHLPVVDDGKLVGVVSVGDLVKSIIGSQRELIRQLENFIQEHSSIT